MTIRFAAARRSDVSVLVRMLSTDMPLNSANDNGDAIGTGNDGDKVLKAALRHFAAYGLSAAERAREQAEAAFFAGDSETYRWWMAICATLDRRMAAAVSFRSDCAG